MGTSKIRTSVLLEIYFDGDKVLTFPLSLITRQAEAARILVEEFDNWAVELPSLEEFVRLMSGRTLDEIVASGSAIGKWRILSVKRIVEDANAGKSEKKEKEPDEESASPEWRIFYERGHVGEAVDAVTKEIAKNPPRPIAARLYNNRGYMRYGMKDKKNNEELAKRD